MIAPSRQIRVRCVPVLVSVEDIIILLLLSHDTIVGTFYFEWLVFNYLTGMIGRDEVASCCCIRMEDAFASEDGV